MLQARSACKYNISSPFLMPVGELFVRQIGAKIHLRIHAEWRGIDNERVFFEYVFVNIFIRKLPPLLHRPYPIRVLPYDVP